MIHELESVALTADFPDHGLEAGDVGKVVHRYAADAAYEVEFLAGDGTTLAVLTLEEDDLRTGLGRSLEGRLLAPSVTLHAPHLVDPEVAQVTRRWTLQGDLTEARGGQLLDDLAGLPLERYAHRRLLPRIWELRANVSAYDATCLALAEALDAPLLTRDRALGSVPGCRADVEVL